MAKKTRADASLSKNASADTVLESAQRITRSLVNHIAAIAEECDAAAIFVYADGLPAALLPLPGDLGDKVFYVTKTATEQRAQQNLGNKHLRVPNVPLTRLGRVNIAVFLALSRGILKPGDIVVCLTGIGDNGSPDTVVVTQVGFDLEIFNAAEPGEQIPSHLRPEVVERVVDIAAAIGNEGREGKPAGALFVVGDTERVVSLSRQIILNPFRGYSQEERNILDPRLEETVKELTTIDGAFVVRGDGVVETCGTYLTTTGQEENELPRGLGARHHAAAAITAVADCIAVTVSESTGKVCVFRGGKIITEIEKSRSRETKRQSTASTRSAGEV